MDNHELVSERWKENPVSKETEEPEEKQCKHENLFGTSPCFYKFFVNYEGKTVEVENEGTDFIQDGHIECADCGHDFTEAEREELVNKFNWNM